MLSIFRKKKEIANEDIVAAIVTQTGAMIQEMQRQMDLRFKEVSAQIKEVELGLAQMESKLLTKDLKDKQAYGLLHYKLHEVKNHKLDAEIEELQEKVDFRNKLKDL